MAMNGYNTGRDVTTQIYGNNGIMQTWTQITMFTSKQDTNDIRVKRLDGKIDIVRIPDGWNGSMETTRQNGAIDNYIAALEFDYYNGADIKPAQITETIRESDGSISQYRYVGVYFKLDDAGDKRGDDVIKQRLSWMATQRLKIQ